MKKIYLSLLIPFTFFTCKAQNEFYINGDDSVITSSPEVYINGRDNTNPTLFVAGSITNKNGNFINKAGEIELTKDFKNETSDVSKSNYNSSGIERFSGDGNSVVSGKMNGLDSLNNFFDLHISKHDSANEITAMDSTNIKNSFAFDTTGIIIVPGSSDLYFLNRDGAISGGANVGGLASNFIDGIVRQRIAGANSYSYPVGMKSAALGSEPITLDFTTADSTDISVSFTAATQTLNYGGRVYLDVGEKDPNSAFNTVNACNGPADGILDEIVLNVHSTHQWNVNKGDSGTNYLYSINVKPSSSADPGSLDLSAYSCETFQIKYLAKNGNIGGDGVTVDIALPSFVDSGYHVAPTGNTLTGQTSFSAFRLHSATASSTTLPIDLLSLTAKPIENQYIQVNWLTASEINNSGFELQRSIDGINFEKIAWVKGNGTTSNKQSYTFNDTEVDKNTVYYYRLNQIDFDGANEHSYIVDAKLNSASTLSFNVYPNPNKINKPIYAEIYTNEKSVANLSIYNIQSKLLSNKIVYLEKGKNIVKIENNQLAVGSYFIRLEHKDKIESKLITFTK